MNSNVGGGIISFTPADVLTLYKSYMPFIKGGGLFLTTNKKYDLGSEVFAIIKLPGESDRIPVVGKVVWINRSGSAIKPSGIGIQFSESSENAIAKDRIEVAIAGISADTPTYTM